MNQPQATPFVPHVEKFRDYLCLLARAHLRPGRKSRLEASDLVQQTLIEAYQQRDLFRGQSDRELAAWLKQALAHNLADALRGEARVKRDIRRECPIDADIDDSFGRVEDWLCAADPSPSEHAIRIEQMLLLAKCLVTLPEDQREVVVMHHLQGWTLEQLAERIQRTEASIAGLLRRGLKRLRELMQEKSE